MVSNDHNVDVKQMKDTEDTTMPDRIAKASEEENARPMGKRGRTHCH
jgi:hypothetical protein